MIGVRGRWWLMLALCAGGCATTRVVAVDVDRRADFQRYRTFDVRDGQVVREGLPDPGDTLVRDRVDAALSAELTEKGLRPDPKRPDLIVSYTTGTRTLPVIGYGYGEAFAGDIWID